MPIGTQLYQRKHFGTYAEAKNYCETIYPNDPKSRHEIKTGETRKHLKRFVPNGWDRAMVYLIEPVEDGFIAYFWAVTHVPQSKMYLYT